MDKVKEFKSIVNQMADTYEKKNSNYGDSFGKLFDELGPVSGLVPLYNKLHRATSLVNGDVNHFESLEDTLIDMACYAIMNVIEMRRARESATVEQISIENYFPTYQYTTTGAPAQWMDVCTNCDRKNIVNGCDGCGHLRYNVTCGGGTISGN